MHKEKKKITRGKYEVRRCRPGDEESQTDRNIEEGKKRDREKSERERGKKEQTVCSIASI